MADLDLEDIKKKKINISVENLAMLGVGIFSLVGMWFAIQSDLEEGKRLPEAEVSRQEFSMKDEMIREKVINIEEKVNENGEKLKDIDDKLYEIIMKK
tara:strand:- start:6288 stop:6581 length:294 start_codon:yes stop_codon:yes gene_type:complete